MISQEVVGTAQIITLILIQTQNQHVVVVIIVTIVYVCQDECQDVFNVHVVTSLTVGLMLTAQNAHLVHRIPVLMGS